MRNTNRGINYRGKYLSVSLIGLLFLTGLIAFCLMCN